MSDRPIDQRERWNDLEEAGRIATESALTDVWTSMPGIVVAHDRDKNTISVQPAIKQKHVKADGTTEWLQMPELRDVPIQYPGGGGASWTFPLKEGDEVLLNFASRNIDKWWQQGGVQEQHVPFRMHDISDAFAIPGFRSQPRKLKNVHGTAAELRSDDGSLVIQFDADEGSITIKSSAHPVRIEGDLNVTGEVKAKCDSAPIKLSTHLHGGVLTGGGQTNKPVPGT